MFATVERTRVRVKAQPPRSTFISASKISRRRRRAAFCSSALRGFFRSSGSWFSPTASTDARGGRNRRLRLLAGAVQKLPVAIDELAVRVDLAAGAKVADKIPVERRSVEGACLRIRGAEGEVHRPAHLLVEQGVAGEHRDRPVHAEGELAETSGALVHRDHLAKEVLAALRRGLDHLAGLEAQTHAFDLARVE